MNIAKQNLTLKNQELYLIKHEKSEDKRTYTMYVPINSVLLVGSFKSQISPMHTVY